MAMKTFTVADLHRWAPCWTQARLQRVTDLYEDEPWTILDVANTCTLPRSLVRDQDRLWLLDRMCDEMPNGDRLRHRIALRFAEQILVPEQEPGVIEAIARKRRYLEHAWPLYRPPNTPMRFVFQRCLGVGTPLLTHLGAVRDERQTRQLLAAVREVAAEVRP